MAQETIKCPKCGESIELSQAISNDIEVRLKGKHEREVADVKRAAALSLKNKENEIQEKVEKIRISVIEEVKKEAGKAQRLEITDLRNRLEERERQIEDSEQRELALRKKQRELDEKEKKLELEMKRKMDEERQGIIEKTMKESEKDNRLKDAEREKQLESMKEQMAEKTHQIQKMHKEQVSVREKERELAEKEKAIDANIEGRLEKEREATRVEVLKTADSKGKQRIKMMQDQLAETQKNLEDAQKIELEFRNKQRELEKEKQRLELDVARKVDEERNKIREETLQIATEGHKLKDAEKEKQLESMRKQIDGLKRKAEQGSQKIQGEVLEIELEEMLSQDFPFDVIEPVSPGIKGGDIVHTINTQSGKYCGKILWETKRTKTWNEKWIQKVKDDQRNAKADIAVIVSEALPDGFHHFRQIDGVWVTDIPSASSLALALRVILTKAANERRMQAGKEEKMEVVYGYLTGLEFKNRVEAIVETFISMKDDLEREKAVAQRHWAKREKNIGRVIANTVGMYGDLEGIAGAALPAIKMLELPLEQEVVTEDPGKVGIGKIT